MNQKKGSCVFFISQGEVVMDDVFSAVRSHVTARQIAEAYGIRVSRTGMACCPFHNDRHPSFKVDERFYCFGCGSKGDAVDFVSQYEGISLLDAAKKIADEYGIVYGTRPRTQPHREKTTEDRFKVALKKCDEILHDYRRLLIRWEKDYSPKTMEEEWHPLYIEALQQKDYVEYCIDLINMGNIEDKAQLLVLDGRRINKINERIKQIRAGIIAPC